MVIGKDMLLFGKLDSFLELIGYRAPQFHSIHEKVFRRPLSSQSVIARSILTITKIFGKM